MRGRTNVPQRKAPTINGTVQNMIVASGKSVIIGDFVQYKMQEQNDRISGDTEHLMFRTNFKIGQNLFTKQDTNTVKLISNDDLYTVEDYVSGVNHWKLSDGNIVVLYDIYLRLYSIVNKRFNLLQEVNIGYKYGNSSNDRYTLVCQLSDGRIMCLEHYSSGSARTGWFKIFTYASQEISTEFVEFSSGLFSGSSVPIEITVGTGNSFALLINSSGSMSINPYVCGENSITTKTRVYTTGTLGGMVSLIGTNGYCIQMGATSSGLPYGVEIYSLTSAGLESVYAINPVSYVSKVSQAAGWSATFIDENKILVAVADGGTTGSVSCGYFVIELGNEIITSNVIYKTMTYTQKNTYYNAALLSSGTGFINDNNNIFFTWATGSAMAQTDYSGEYLIKLNYYDGVLELGSATSYVEKWNGGRALGFAKTGGSSGDTIQVYVPQISS